MLRKILTAMILTAAATPALAAEIRICERELRTAPLSDERGVQSALIQGFAVVNNGAAPEMLTGIQFQLKDQGQVRDTRRLLHADIARAVKQSPQVATLAGIFPAQFCNGDLLKGVKLGSSATLAPGEALVFLYQPFAWQGDRDMIEIAAETEREGQVRTDKLALNVVRSVSKTKVLFPVAGRSFVPVAAGFHTPHRWGSIEEFAVDILALGPNGLTYRGKGNKLGDYAAFGRPVRSVAAGKVVTARDGTADNAQMLKRPGESDEAYLVRLQEGQLSLLAKGMDAVLGNHVVIDHGNGEFSIYAHLKAGSVSVAAGAQIAAGEMIGLLGSSGNSTEPHLHFQICDGPDIATCRPIPANFVDYRIPFELAPRTIQSGDIIETTK